MNAALTAGQLTDLQLLALRGASIQDRGDHLVVRSPFNPDFHWGNFVQVTTGPVEDTDRWIAIFEQEFPGRSYRAIGLPSMPAPAPYAAHGLQVSTDDCLSTRTRPRGGPLADGYRVRPMSGADWEQLVQRELAENAATGEHDPHEHERFMRAQVSGRQRLIRDGHAQFFGAFAGDRLAASLGIAVLTDTARYQDVSTAPGDRRRGLARHLLGVAADWAAARGSARWVIVTESTNPAGRLYRSAGLTDLEQSVSAYRNDYRASE